MTTEIEIKEYIRKWLVGLNIGPVYVDSMPAEDPSEQREVRTYIIMSFPDGIIDEGCWRQAVCAITVGCRNKQPNVPDAKTIEKVSKLLKARFEEKTSDDVAGIQMVDLQYVDGAPYGEMDYEQQYVFDVYAHHTHQDDVVPN